MSQDEDPDNIPDNHDENENIENNENQNENASNPAGKKILTKTMSFLSTSHQTIPTFGDSKFHWRIS